MRLLGSLAFVVCVVSTACGSDPPRGGGDDDDGGSSAPSGGGTSSGGGPYGLCVDTINQYRAGDGLPPYERWNDAEGCSDSQAQSDSASGTPHGAFGQCGEWAQNECPGWGGAPETVIVDCLAMMWDEGPGGGHHDAMASTEYTRVACGFHDGGGGVWSVQNFQ